MKKTLMVISVMALLGLLLTQPLLAHKAAAAKLQGTVTISGAWALYPMVVKWSEEFRKLHPGVRFDISAGGAGKGIADTLAGMVDIGMVSREIYPAEVKKGAWYIPVAKDAVVPVFNRHNPLFREILKQGVKKSEFTRIWLEEETPTWKELLGGKGGVPIHVYTRSDSCGAAETWALFMGKKQEDLLGIGVYGDPGLNEAVRHDALGIGFNNISYAFDSTTLQPQMGTAILPIDLNGNGKIDLAEDFYDDRNSITRAIADGKYPSPPARNLYFVFKSRPKKALISAFVKWIVGEGQKFVHETGYIGLTSGEIDQTLAKIRREQKIDARERP